MAQGDHANMTSRLDLTPSPRLLQVLGDLPYQPWQCLAELIDNAFDDFLADDQRDPSEPCEVRVTLPKSNTNDEDAVVRVADNGRGMTERTLENALKAGYSEKSRHGSLGLFGMGFNIATARLGNVTEVRTTRAGDLYWLVAEIDFRAMQRQRTFAIPLRREPKPDPSIHGTEVIVTRLRPDARDRLRRSSTVTQIRERLGNIYSYMLRSKEQVPELPGPMLAGRGFTLIVNNVRVQPRLPCVWSPKREVDYRGRKIPVVIEINKQLNPAWACMACGHWHPVQSETCVECESPNLQLRERRIVGWLGIQRYLDPTDFGIDLLRNGRKILVSDKSLFDWEHPDTGEVWKEYPIELGSTTGGRIVGEVHLDHVPVVYQKNDFERSSKDWLTAVHVIRGEGPLQPRKAKSVGFGENMSPLGLLFHGYRRNDPGVKCLIPGDGKNALHERAREWAQRFRKGQAEYLTDDRWYEQAVEHDRLKRGAASAAGADIAGSSGPISTEHDVGSNESEVLSRTGLLDIFGDVGGMPGLLADQAPRPETEEERFARYRKAARRMHDLSGDIAIGHLAKRQIVAYETTENLVDAFGAETPSVSRSLRGNVIEVYVNSDHYVFRECGRDPRDYVIIQLAEQLRADGRLNLSIARVAADVTASIPDQRLTDAAIRERIDGVLRRVRELLLPIAVNHSAALWACLPNSEKVAAERTALADEPRLIWPNLTADGKFVNYVGLAAVAAIVRERPDLVLDGSVFTTTWATWSSDEIKERQVARLARNLELIGEFAATADAKSRLERAMARLTLDMLDQEIRWDD